MNPRLQDPSVALVDVLDESELALVRAAIFRKPYGLVSFQEYLDREEKLQPAIKEIASKFKISRHDHPDRWEEVCNLRPSDG